MKKRMLVAVVGLGLALVAASCGSSDHGSSSDISVPADASHNAADVMFVQGMIPHHEQAVEMADLALANTTTAPILTLATQIRAAQDPEIQTMRGWLKTWGQKEMSMDDGGHGAMDGMMGEGDMKKLEAARDGTFDPRFLEMMIEHHEGAIKMSEKVKADGKSAEVRTLADAIITAQQAEIAEMKALQGTS